MNRLENQLLHQETGPAEPRLCIRSATRVDTGRWLRRSRLWLCVVADELVTLAVSRRRYFGRIPLADCGASHYNHATGELVIEPAGPLPINRLKLSPREATQVLDLLQNEQRKPNTELC